MLARVAEALFGVARDLERVETTARLLQVTQDMNLEADGDPRGGSGDWRALVRIVSDYDAFLASYSRADEAVVGWHLTLSDENPDAINATITRARERARSVRDRLSTDVWEGLNGLYLELEHWNSGRMQRQGVYAFGQTVRQRIYLILGLIDTTLRRDDHWTFLRLGRFLERSLLSARLVAVRATELLPADPVVGAPLDLHRWSALLHDASAYESYARTHPGITAESVLRYLVLDDRFPRSVAFSLGAVEQCQLSLIDDLALVPDARPLRLTQEARELLRDAEGALLFADPSTYLERLQDYCVEIADATRATCFAAAYTRPGGTWDAQAQGQSQN
jgi:uncharacterized alpha-E superfamily protein